MLKRKGKNAAEKEVNPSVTEIPEGFVFLSKTVQSAENGSVPGLDVETHCRITGFVARSLVSLFPVEVGKILFPESAPFLAAIHDVGKINPDFQKMIYRACASGNDAAVEWLSSLNANSESAKRSGMSFHAKVTQIFLSEKYPEFGKFVAKIEGMHHGFRPCDSNSYPENCYGGSGWTKARETLLCRLEEEFGRNRHDLRSWGEACVIGGLIVVSDWIASGGAFSGLKSPEKPSSEDIRRMADEAVREAGFRRLSIRRGLSFSEIFGFEPRKAQKTFFDSVSGPGVYILEAPMGMGKTEAALYAAYKVLGAGKACGIYFALPTQLTSNRIHGRVESFLRKILAEGCGSLRLLHGSAWMERTFGEDGDIGKSWFDGRKRGILAPFAVGTVDQALMSVMDVRHGMVRAFGLAGKVVILDEIHSYDAYTGTILNALVERLCRNGCTVILLSATLTARQKRDILRTEGGYVFGKSYPLISKCASEIRRSENPLITSEVSCGKLEEIPESADGGNNVSVRICTERMNAVEEALEKAWGGQQVLWIENTVREAQDTFCILASRCGGTVECGLVHSRFEKIHRAKNEDYWVGLYGSGGKNRRTEKGRILVGTQVLEQSLDIDADFLVTAICPTDMLLQRMGRLWRHPSNSAVRPAGAECACVIVAPDFDSVLGKRRAFGVSGAVYSEYVLCRTYEIWKDRTLVALPGDIRGLLEETYSERDEAGLWKSYKNEMIERRSRLEAFANFARLRENTLENTKTEGQVQTRYSEQESVSVLLVKSIEKTGDGTSVEFLSGEKIFVPSSGKKIPYKERIEISRAIMEHCVTVPEKNAPKFDRNFADGFSDYVYVGSDDDGHPFRCARVGRDKKLFLEDSEIAGLKYDERLGYRVMEDF